MDLLLIDDQNVVREALALALQGRPGIDTILQAECAREALALLDRHACQLAILELSLPDQAGSELIRRLKAREGLRVIVLSTHRDEFSIAEAMRAGADGYLSKRASLNDLLGAIESVVHGRGALSSDVSAAMVRAMQRREVAEGNMVAALSERERQVLRLLALGSSAKEVAAQLSISVKTVETHRARLCAKVATNSVADLTRLAVRSGLVQA
ncbi:response regulator transcription factor [Chondromyces crocatus]|uniref:Transcriptional regulator n=1 Tax=Chondromyces crocatus TaxID=52 RepID=A0A0K1EH94_CHOCO|nr:response regulator transcription factor [Chondromyces crocatus]AKT40052.1 transcriptional regulator [Chondromyces crocatus]